MSRSNVSCCRYCLTGSRPSICLMLNSFSWNNCYLPVSQRFSAKVTKSVTLKYSEKPFEPDRVSLSVLAVQTRLDDFYLQYWRHFGAFPSLWPFSCAPWVLSVVSALISHLNTLLIVLAYVELAFSPCWGSMWWGRGKRTWRTEGVTGWGQYGALSSLNYENCIIWFVNEDDGREKSVRYVLRENQLFTRQS